MTGSSFVRVDLHVHSFPDDGSTPDPPGDYIQAALNADVRVLAVTDHNTARNVGSMMEAAVGSGVLVLPGVEVTTHQGHLLAVFPDDAVDACASFADGSNLQLHPDPFDAAVQRSSRHVLDLVDQIYSLGGLAIPAHVDLAGSGIAQNMNRTELCQLFACPGLAAIEIARRENATWFTEGDSDPTRLAALAARREALGSSTIAMLMSSDAHSADKVGAERRRGLTRLRMDEINFTAVRNAIVFRPAARCRVEDRLPPSYPRIVRARFEGGFLDGVEIDISDNLTCFIGGRGSGKSTALIAIRAALGARLSSDDDPDAVGRMPERTEVVFIDATGTERTIERSRSGVPIEKESGATAAFRVLDLGQDEFGQLARGYGAHDVSDLRAFLDRFCELDRLLAEEQSLLRDMRANREVVSASAPQPADLTIQSRLDSALADLAAANSGKVEVIARYRRILGSETPLIEELRASVADVSKVPKPSLPDLDGLALRHGAELAERPASDHLDGDDGIRALLSAFDRDISHAHTEYVQRLQTAAIPISHKLAGWKQTHQHWTARLAEAIKELEDQGLSVQVGAVEQISARITAVREEQRSFSERQQRHQTALRERRKLLMRLSAIRERIFQQRKAKLRSLCTAANKIGSDLTISVAVRHAEDRESWAEWLGKGLAFRKPRVSRLAADVGPFQLAEAILRGRTESSSPRDSLLALVDAGNFSYFDDEDKLPGRVDALFNWTTLFDVQEWRVEDHVAIFVQRSGEARPKDFASLSAGQ